MEQDTTHHTDCMHVCGVGMKKHSPMWTLVLVLFGIFILALTVKTLKEVQYVGGGIAPTNAISVSGTGEAVAVPDVAEFTFSVIEEGDTAVLVRDAATTKVQGALAALEAQGVERADIKTVLYELQPKYEWEPIECVGVPCVRNQVQSGFMLTQSVRVKVRDLDKAGSLLEAVTNTGVQSVSGLTFTVDDEDATQMQARKAAIEDARTKADALARDLGVSLVRIIGFSEDGGYPMPYYAEAAMGVGMGGDMAVKSAPAVPAGENTVTSRVMITYEIR